MTASAAGSAIAAARPDAQRARQPVLRSRVHHAPLGSPLDRGLHVVGAPAQHHDRVGQAGVGDRVEGVLQEGPALERRQQLRRPEPGARAGGQDDRDHLHPVAPVATAASRARASSRIGRPVPDRRSATISAMIASAVSDGSRPPRSSPIGPRSRSTSSCGHAGLEQPRAAVRLGLARADGPDVPAAAMERLDDRRLVELHVVGQHRDRVGRPEADLVGELVRPPDQQAVDVREPRLGRERRPPVDDHGLVAQLLGQPDQRARDLDRPDDDEARTDRVRLDEQLAAGHLDRPRHAVREGVTRRVHERRVGGSVAQRALELAVLVDHQDVGGFRARRRVGGAERRRRRVRGQRRDDCATVAATLAGLPAPR